MEKTSREQSAPATASTRQEKKREAVKEANLLQKKALVTPSLAKPSGPAVRYCATMEPTAYLQGTAKEVPSGFSKEQGEVGRAPRPDSARIQIEVSVRPAEPREDEAFEVSARLVNGGDTDLTLARVEESAVRAHGGFQPISGLSLPTTASVGGVVGIYRYGGVLRGGSTYFKELRVTDSLGDSWKTSVRLLPCPER